MNKAVVKFVLALLIVGAITKGAINYFGLTEPTFFWLITSFLLCISVLSFALLHLLGGKNPEGFIKVVLASMVVKLIIYIILVAVVIMLDKENANANAVLFLTLYIGYTLLEVGFVFKQMSSHN